MKKTGIYLMFCIITLLVFSDKIISQEKEYSYFYTSSNLTFLNSEDKPYQNPFSGGMYKPQFSNIDLNFNGIEDVFVFDRSDGRIMTFYNNGSSINPQFTYTSEYDEIFPELRNFALLKDYYQNGLNDIFTFSPGSSGIRVYRNISENGKLKFVLATNQIQQHKHNCEEDANLYVNSSDLPGLGDVSGNGEMDILSFQAFGGRMNYFRNVSMDCHETLESLAFTRLDFCWGRFFEGGPSNTIMLQVYDNWCDQYGKYGKKEGDFNKKHSGASPTLIDINGNGAIDLLIGDTEYPNLQLLINGKHSFGSEPYRRDTMIQVIEYFPPSHPVNIYSMPAAYLLDIYNNGKQDMVVAPNDIGPTQTLNQVWLYKNVSETDSFDFEFITENFLQNTMIDIGRNSSPAFVDINGNGLLDLIIGTGEDTTRNQFKGDRLVLFENIGTIDSAIFKMTDNDFMGLSENEWIALHPAFGDLNGNGSVDMLLGNFNGTLIYFENLASADEKVDFQFVTANYANINVGKYSTPFIFDYNNDGKADLIIGSERGTIFYYENTGTETSVEFELVTDTLGQIIVNQSFVNYIRDGQGNIIDTVYSYAFEGNSAPVIADLNNNGEFELIVGSLHKGVRFYKIAKEDPKAEFEMIPELYFSRYLEKGINKVIGKNTKPAIAVLDTNKFPDMLIGNRRGGLFYFSTIDFGAPSAVIDEDKFKNRNDLKRFNIYPNPANSQITISPFGKAFDNDHELSIYNILGKQLVTYNFNGITEHTFELPKLKTSVYIIIIRTTDGNVIQRSKLQVNSEN